MAFTNAVAAATGDCSSTTTTTTATKTSNIVPIRVDVLSEDKTIRIVDTLLFDPTCWPVAWTSNSTASATLTATVVEENVIQLAHTILSDAEVQVCCSYTQSCCTNRHSHCSYLANTEKTSFSFCHLPYLFGFLLFLRFSESSFLLFQQQMKRAWEGPFDTLRAGWICGAPNSKRPLKTSSGHSSGRLPWEQWYHQLQKQQQIQQATSCRYPFGS